ncbi:sensor histidine kinase [Massilia glaciei]|uniref:histidine kinase n=1 Tax=Massilia glaciei TaxID=1524097 RepID=A0A2U2HM13_9BURK|nr:PAS domain-containing sensor histidine kinase [Massilia glaciei]
MERARALEARLAAQRLQHEQQRAESARLKSMFSQAPGFMCILGGPEHVFKFANTAYGRLVGARELLGKKLRDALPEIAEQGFLALLDQVFRSAQPYVADNVPVSIQRSAQGPPTTSYLDFIHQPIVGADGKATEIFVEGFDATERHFAKAALEASEQRLKEGMLAARMVIWDWELSGGRTTFSDNAGILFGGQWHEAESVWERVVPEGLALLEEKRALALARLGSYQEVVRLVRPDNGDTLWLQVHGTVIADGDGRACAIRGVALDVTERKQAEEALRRADRRKDEFLAMLAHELRNPLAPISAAAQLLKMRGNDEARVRRSSEVIGRQVEHMTSLINDMLDVSRFNAGLVSLHRELLDLREVVAESTEQARPLMQLRRHRFDTTGVELPLMVLADRTRLVQVLTNLIQNSAKFTPPGGDIGIALDVCGAEVSISVGDNGVGMAPELVPHVLSCSRKANARRTGRRAALAWACRSSKAWSICTAGGSGRAATARTSVRPSP